MNNYEVWLRDKRTGNKRSIILWAESFGHAEELAMDGSLTRKWFDIGNEEIIKIDKEYDTDTQLFPTDDPLAQDTRGTDLSKDMFRFLGKE